jgi:hypothetical protein
MEAIKKAALIEILNSSAPKKIGILDNNTINFLTKINKYVHTDMVLRNYDLLLIPNWVYEEVTDSEERVNYIKDVFNKDIQIYIINEYDYEELVGYKSEWLYKFFLYSSFLNAELKSFIKRNIEKNQPLEELDDYEEWLKLLYEDGFHGKILKSGRSQKKNAGEISISILSLIISYFYFEKNHYVSVISNDRDTYDYIKFAKQKLLKDMLFEKLEGSVITFKSNDLIIKEIYLNNYIIEGHDIYSIVEFRDAKRVKYTRNTFDNSVEEHDEVLSNGSFIQNLKDNTFNIIF